MAAPVTVQSNVDVAVSPLASVTVTVTVFTPGVIKPPADAPANGAQFLGEIGVGVAVRGAAIGG